MSIASSVISLVLSAANTLSPPPRVTSALHICLLLAGVDAGDEVLVPTLTFIATANAVSYIRAVPHFVESEAVSLGVDAGKLDAVLRQTAQIVDDVCVNRRTGAPIRALVIMHVFGDPSDVDALAELATRWKLVLIEDAAGVAGRIIAAGILEILAVFRRSALTATRSSPPAAAALY